MLEELVRSACRFRSSKGIAAQIAFGHRCQLSCFNCNRCDVHSHCNGKAFGRTFRPQRPAAESASHSVIDRRPERQEQELTAAKILLQTSADVPLDVILLTGLGALSQPGFVQPPQAVRQLITADVSRRGPARARDRARPGDASDPVGRRRSVPLDRAHWTRPGESLLGKLI